MNQINRGGRIMLRLVIRTLVSGICIFSIHPSISDAEDLLEIYQRAVQYDPTIQEAEATYLATLEARPQAISRWLPVLRVSAGLSADHNEDPTRPTDFQSGVPSALIRSTASDRDSNNWNVSLTQPIFDWGRYVGLRQADKVVARADADMETVRQALLVRVSEAYFNVLAAEDSLAAQTTARESLARQLEQAQRRFEVGLIAITDVQEAQAGFDLAVATEIAAQQTLASALESLRAIIGAHVTDLAGPTEQLPLVSPDPTNPEDWVRAALEQNPTLTSSRISADIAEDGIDIERASRLPTLMFSTNYNQSDIETLRTNNLVNGTSASVLAPTAPQGYSWSLNLVMPLYQGGLVGSRVQQTVYQHRAALDALERVARETERQTRDAYLRVLSEVSRVRALRQAVESSRTALSATEAGFEVGTRTTVEVVASQNNLSQAETGYARSRYDYILNVLRLKQAAGGLSAPDLEEINGWLE
jgi:outer membrane protein